MEDKIRELIEKADTIKKQEKMDLSSDQDLTIAIMNMISIEEHLFFTAAKTGKTAYYDLINEVREIRKQMLKKIIKDYEGEVWCISKHLLSASMRLMEVGTKQLSMGNKEQAYELFERSYQLYSLFWGLNMKILVGDNGSKINSGEQSSQDKPSSINNNYNSTVPVNSADIPSKDLSGSTPKKGVMKLLGDLVKKVVDCCIE